MSLTKLARRLRYVASMAIALTVGAVLLPGQAIAANDERRAFNDYAFLTFSENEYIELNSDLAGLAACRTGGVQLNAPLDCVEQHFASFGRFEGRQSSYKFDPAVYRATNADLARLSTPDLYRHYTNFGFSERRISSLCRSNVFDANFYRNLNPDLAGLSSLQLCAHYKSYGLNEGRQGSSKFNVATYRSRYSDLAALSPFDAAIHYLVYGENENRTAI